MRTFRYMIVLMAIGFSSVQQAVAFPGWMGVYDYYLRHDGQNPGRFLILMNASYVGLEANVGLRVNDGPWTEYPMSYVTDVDGNSMWEYIPSQPFPFVARLEFYFHGYETNPPNSIYDSRNASNYFAGPLSWNQPEILPMFSVYPGNNLMTASFASGGEVLYLAAAYPGINTNFIFSKKIPGKEWITTTGPGEDTAVGEFAIAAAGDTVIAAYRLDTNIVVRKSADGGTSWGSPVPLASVPNYGSLSGISAASRPDGAFAVAYGIATNCCGAQNIYASVFTNGALAWSTPQSAYQAVNFGDYATGFKMAGNGNGWFLGIREVLVGPTSAMRGGWSSNGLQWVTTYLGGNFAWSEADISASTGRVLIAADPYYDSSTWVWQSMPGGGWVTQKIFRTLESGTQVWLGNDQKSTWYLYRYEDNDSSPTASTYLPTYRVSTDEGGSWGYPVNVHYVNPGANNHDSLKKVISSSGPKQQLIWSFSQYVNTLQSMLSYRLQASDGFGETLSVSMLPNGQIQIDATNLTAGMSHVLQAADEPDSTNWVNLANWSYGSTNMVITPLPGNTSISYKVKSSY